MELLGVSSNLKKRTELNKHEFELKVGQEIEFEISNAKYNTAKLIRKPKHRN